MTKREKEIHDRNLYLKNFWYAATISEKLKVGKTLKVEMMGRTITLFRDENGVVGDCFDRYCLSVLWWLLGAWVYFMCVFVLVWGLEGSCVCKVFLACTLHSQ